MLIRLVLFLLVLAGCGPKPAPSSPRAVMVVDRQYDRAQPPGAPGDEIPAASYRAVAPEERWSVAIEGAHVVLVPLAKEPAAIQRIEGDETSGAAGERRFELKNGVFAGGRFVLRGDEAELTIYGSGVPIVSSERGRVVTR